MNTAFWYQSPIGVLKITLTEKGVRQLELSPKNPHPPQTPSTPLEHHVAEILQRYFSGESVDFSVIPLDPDTGTDFQRAVWDTLKTIPRGEVRSYAWVASQIGKPKAVRAVGQANGKNPLPILVPCHRVVSANGGLGGFMQGQTHDALDLKRTLLSLEGVCV